VEVRFDSERLSLPLDPVVQRAPCSVLVVRAADAGGAPA
jgi:hypothetical protein